MSVLSIQDQERRRIARALHETTSQNLAALQINLKLIERAAKSLPQRVRQALVESLALAERCALEIRALSYSLHPPLLDELGLVAALRVYAADYMARTGVTVRLDLPGKIGGVTPEAGIALFRILEEGLSRIHHGVAVLRLTKKRTLLLLELTGPGKFGGAATRARVRDLGAKMVIEPGRMQIKYEIVRTSRRSDS